MALYNLIEQDGDYVLELPAGAAPEADEVVEGFELTPNGYFWEGVAELLLDGPLSAYADRVQANAEPEAFMAQGDQEALEALGEALEELLTQPEALEEFIEQALEEGFEFEE